MTETQAKKDGEKGAGAEGLPTGEEVREELGKSEGAEEQPKAAGPDFRTPPEEGEDAKRPEKPPEPQAVASITITVFDNETASYQVVGPLDRLGVGRVFQALGNGVMQAPLFPKVEKPASA